MAPPSPMPIAAHSPSLRDAVAAIRETKTKLGPGLTAPTSSAPRIPKRARDADMARSLLERSAQVIGGAGADRANELSLRMHEYPSAGRLSGTILRPREASGGKPRLHSR